jgi:hypothetical protein
MKHSVKWLGHNGVNMEKIFSDYAELLNFINVMQLKLGQYEILTKE